MIMPHCHLVIFLGILIGPCICSPLGLYCDFEEPCAWEPEPKTGFTVIKANGIDRPMRDYTKNATDGHLILVDTAQFQNYTHASLQSPWFEKSGPNCKLQFAVYMIGDEVGPLTIVKKIHNYSLVIWNKDLKVGTSSGKSKELPWTLVTVIIGEIKTPFQIFFESIQASHNSITALDGIKMVNCFPDMPAINGCTVNEFQCPSKVCIKRDQVCDMSEDCLYGVDEKQDCDKLPENATCDFESGWCGWQNLNPNVKLSWIMHQGSTYSPGTGPSVDHTYRNTSGHFIFFKSLLAPNVRQPAVLQSPLLRPPPDYHFKENSTHYASCKIRFFYHMYGKETVPLALLIVMKGPNKTEKMLWRIPSQNEDAWKRVAIAIPQNVNNKFYLQFAAKKRLNFRGDLGLDDISFSPECFGLGVGLNESHEFIDSGTSDSSAETPECFEFNTCGAKGPHGPTQSQCDNTYQQNKMRVRGILLKYKRNRIIVVVRMSTSVLLK